MKVKAEGAQLHVHVRGPEGGPPVVLLHGFPLHGGMWNAQVEALADRWRVIIPDMRGHGQSDVGDGQYAIDFLADDLFAVLDELAPGTPVAACGLSMGGYILLRAFEREPKRFGSLVLADTKSGADNDEGRLKRLDAVRKLRKEGAAAYAEAFAKGALAPVTFSERPAVVQSVKDMISGNAVPGMVGAQLAMASRSDTTPVLGRIEVPALVLVGQEDGLTPPAVAQEMAGKIKGARLTVIPGAGHLSAMEAPADFNQALRGFLEGLDPGT